MTVAKHVNIVCKVNYILSKVKTKTQHFSFLFFFLDGTTVQY